MPFPAWELSLEPCCNTVCTLFTNTKCWMHNVNMVLLMQGINILLLVHNINMLLLMHSINMFLLIHSINILFVDAYVVLCWIYVYFSVIVIHATVFMYVFSLFTGQNLWWAFCGEYPRFGRWSDILPDHACHVRAHLNINLPLFSAWIWCWTSLCLPLMMGIHVDGRVGVPFSLYTVLHNFGLQNTGFCGGSYTCTCIARWMK